MPFSFLIKMGVAIALVTAFDWMFPGGPAGSVTGLFAGLWLIGLVAARTDVRRDRRAWIAMAAAMLFLLSLVDDPGALGWTLFWCALSLAALMPRTIGFDDAWHWAARLGLHAASSGVQPLADLRQSLRRTGGERRGVRATLAILALPLLGGGLFLALFAAANPVIAHALAAVHVPSLWQIVTWIIVGFGLWPSLRPHPAVLRIAGRLPDPEPVLPGTSLPSVLIALAIFNALFAVQNLIDIAVLWGGGPLPAGLTQAEYVHRGAYPLIVTALLAGVMALAMLRPGSASEHHPWARRMVLLWVAQTMILVASSVWRTIDYIEASMLTGWRIAALAWMALVALGLATIGWRILKGRSATWLVNRNAAAALVVLTPCAFVDLGAVAAAWNVRHQAPADIDLCYLSQVGDGALLPLIALERRPMDAATRDRVRHVRGQITDDLAARQAGWTTWTPRGARRLAQAHAQLGPRPAGARPLPKDSWRDCDGRIIDLSAPPRP